MSVMDYLIINKICLATIVLTFIIISKNIAIASKLQENITEGSNYTEGKTIQCLNGSICTSHDNNTIKDQVDPVLSSKFTNDDQWYHIFCTYHDIDYQDKRLFYVFYKDKNQKVQRSFRNSISLKKKYTKNSGLYRCEIDDNRKTLAVSKNLNVIFSRPRTITNSLTTVSTLNMVYINIERYFKLSCHYGPGGDVLYEFCKNNVTLQKGTENYLNLDLQDVTNFASYHCAVDRKITPLVATSPLFKSKLVFIGGSPPTTSSTTGTRTSSTLSSTSTTTTHTTITPLRTTTNASQTTTTAQTTFMKPMNTITHTTNTNTITKTTHKTQTTAKTTTPHSKTFTPTTTTNRVTTTPAKITTIQAISTTTPTINTILDIPTTPETSTIGMTPTIYKASMTTTTTTTPTTPANATNLTTTEPTTTNKNNVTFMTSKILMTVTTTRNPTSLKTSSGKPATIPKTNTSLRKRTRFTSQELHTSNLTTPMTEKATIVNNGLTTPALMDVQENTLKTKVDSAKPTDIYTTFGLSTLSIMNTTKNHVYDSDKLMETTHMETTGNNASSNIKNINLRHLKSPRNSFSSVLQNKTVTPLMSTPNRSTSGELSPPKALRPFIEPIEDDDDISFLKEGHDLDEENEYDCADFSELILDADVFDIPEWVQQASYLLLFVPLAYYAVLTRIMESRRIILEQKMRQSYRRAISPDDSIV